MTWGAPATPDAAEDAIEAAELASWSDHESGEAALADSGGQGCVGTQIVD